MGLSLSGGEASSAGSVMLRPSSDGHKQTVDCRHLQRPVESRMFV